MGPRAGQGTLAPLQQPPSLLSQSFEMKDLGVRSLAVCSVDPRWPGHTLTGCLSKPLVSAHILTPSSN